DRGFGEWLFTGSAMADDMVERGARRGAIAPIAEARTNGVRVNHVFIGGDIARRRRHAGRDFRHEQVEHFRRQTAGTAHAFEAFRAVERHGGRRRTRGSDNGIYLRWRAGHWSNLGIFGGAPSRRRAP